MKSIISRIAGATTLVAMLVSFAPSANAAFATAFADIFISDVRTTDTAVIDFVGPDLFSASSFSFGSVLETGDGILSSNSFTDTDKEAFALNGSLGPGDYASRSEAIAFGFHTASATTFLEAELALSGVGTVEIDISYDLYADIFDTPDGDSAFAEFTASTDFSSDSISLTATGSLLGETLSDIGVITLSFDVDDLGFGPYTDVLILSTEATTVTTPIPAAAWLFFSAVAGLAGARKLNAV